MKIVTKEEWAKAPDEHKKVYDDTFYMGFKETDSNICFVPVSIIDKDNIIDFRRLIIMCKRIFKSIEI